MSLARDTEFFFYILQKQLNQYIFLKLSLENKMRTQSRRKNPSTWKRSDALSPPEDNLSHFREKWSTRHLHTALYHRRQTNRSANQGNQHGLLFKNPEADGERFQTVEGSEKCLSQGCHAHEWPFRPGSGGYFCVLMPSALPLSPQNPRLPSRVRRDGIIVWDRIQTESAHLGKAEFIS